MERAPPLPKTQTRTPISPIRWSAVAAYCQSGSRSTCGPVIFSVAGMKTLHASTGMPNAATFSMIRRKAASSVALINAPTGNSM